MILLRAPVRDPVANQTLLGKIDENVYFNSKCCYIQIHLGKSVPLGVKLEFEKRPMLDSKRVTLNYSGIQGSREK